MRNMPLIELEGTPSTAAANGSKDVSVVPQFVSILNSKGLELSIGEQVETAFSPGPPLPPPCFGKPPPPCVGRPPEPCYGKPPGGPPPCYGGCYGR